MIRPGTNKGTAGVGDVGQVVVRVDSGRGGCDALALAEAEEEDEAGVGVGVSSTTTMAVLVFVLSVALVVSAVAVVALFDSWMSMATDDDVAVFKLGQEVEVSTPHPSFPCASISTCRSIGGSNNVTMTRRINWYIDGVTKKRVN